MEKNNKKYDYTPIVLYIVGFFIFLVLYWIFVFRPVARVETILTKTAQDVETALNKIEKTAQDVENTDRKVDAIIGGIEQILPQLEQVFCNFFPSQCPSVGSTPSSGFNRYK